MSSAVVQMPSIQAGDVPINSYPMAGLYSGNLTVRPAFITTKKRACRSFCPLEREMPENGWPVVLIPRDWRRHKVHTIEKLPRRSGEKCNH